MDATATGRRRGMEGMMFHAIRASKPGALLPVLPCRSFGLRPQREISKRNAKKALEIIQSVPYAVALFDHDGKMVAKSASYPA